MALTWFADVAGDADAAGLGEALEAGRDVDAVAEDVAVLDDDVADVDADAEPDAPVLGHGRLALGHAVSGSRPRIRPHRRRCELDQGAVADELDHAAVVLGDQRLDELLPERLDPRDRAGLVGPDQPAVADHVHGHYRRELAIHARSGHGSLRENPFRTFLQPASLIPARTKSTSAMPSATPAEA